MALSSAELLQRIAGYCRDASMAETTFGRRSVNDGKLVARLRNGRAVTMRTRTGSRLSSTTIRSAAAAPKPAPLPRRAAMLPPSLPPEQNFRFYDNRQKYLMFVNTCSEKWVVAQPGRPGAGERSTRARRRCACSTPASATARC